jgi:hypothetical protein
VNELHDADARRLARELISAAVVGEVPEVTLLEFAEHPDMSERFDILMATVRHARAMVRVVAELLEIEPTEVIRYMAAMDWSQEDESPGHSG